MTNTTPYASPEPPQNGLVRCMDVLRRYQPDAGDSALAKTALALTRGHGALARTPPSDGGVGSATLLAMRHGIDRVMDEAALGRRLRDAFGAQPSTSRTPCVLIVDDAADVLVTLGAFLEGAGFDVLKASGADAALRLLAVTPGIDAIVTDVAMPGMSGVELVHQALEQRPHLPAVVITAYADPKLLETLPSRTRILRKPFRRADLVRCVEELVHAGHGVRAA